MGDFIRDLDYAFRLIRKAPLFSFYVIAPLAFGIGLNGAIFLLLDTFLLRPLPVKKPEELVRVVQVIQNLGPRSYYEYDTVAALAQKSTSFTDVFGYADWNAAVRDASGASRVRVQIVTGNFFTALGVQSMYGRILTKQDEFQTAGWPPVVLSHPYWRREFRGDPGVIGRTITLEDRPFTIVGVMPPRFNGIDVETTPDIRAPLIAAGLLSRDPDLNSYRKFEYTLAARLRPGVSMAKAKTETESIVNAATDAKARVATRDEHLELEPIARGVSLIRAKFSTSLTLLMSGVGLLLLMICANVGGLLLARASARKSEMAVRLAIGASVARLVRQSLTESFVLTAIGGVAGWSVALASGPLLVRLLPTLRDLGATALTVSVDIRPDGRMLIFGAALCLVCALFAGLPAALLGTQSEIHSSLKTARAGARQPWRWTLVAIQIGLCTFLLAGAGLLISTLRHLRALDPGFDRDHVVTFSLDPAMAHYTPAQAADFEKRLTARVREIPSVESAGIAVLGLMRGTGMKTTVAPEGQMTPRSDFLNTSINFVSPEYFEAMGIPLVAGRDFAPNEQQVSPKPVIVNRAFVRRFFPTGDPIGRKFGTGTDKIVPGDYQIIGVVGDAKYRSLREVIPPTMYQPYNPVLKNSNAFVFHVRTRNQPEGVIQAVRKSLEAIDPRLPFYEIRTLADEVDTTLWAERLLACLSSVFAIVAGALATMGVYATLAYAIAQSRREIGIRVALGARARDVLRLFSARPLRIAALGVAGGVASFYAAAPAFRSILFEVSPGDPAAMIVAAAGVLFIALAATLVAVGGALRVDPAVVLREE